MKEKRDINQTTAEFKMHGNNVVLDNTLDSIIRENNFTNKEQLIGEALYVINKYAKKERDGNRYRVDTLIWNQFFIDESNFEDVYNFLMTYYNKIEKDLNNGKFSAELSQGNIEQIFKAYNVQEDIIKDISYLFDYTDYCKVHIFSNDLRKILEENGKIELLKKHFNIDKNSEDCDEKVNELIDKIHNFYREKVGDDPYYNYEWYNALLEMASAQSWLISKEDVFKYVNRGNIKEIISGIDDVWENESRYIFKAMLYDLKDKMIKYLINNDLIMSEGNHTFTGTDRYGYDWENDKQFCHIGSNTFHFELPIKDKHYNKNNLGIIEGQISNYCESEMSIKQALEICLNFAKEFDIEIEDDLKKKIDIYLEARAYLYEDKEQCNELE